ncbi:hypothetical protein [Sulfitobacter sp. JB4-11]|uniref:hypothetical protein n=1 Tax=Sulfitobacter rhodophyticola TaxID=3238304 RepID=UPI003D815BF5
MISTLLKLSQVALLALTLYATGDFLKGTPAFNDDLRDVTVYDSERLPLSAPMYDRGEYLFRIAHTYIFGSVTLSLDGSDPDALSAQSIIANAAIAEMHLSQSLLEKPGNAHAWHLLARARAIQSAPLEDVLPPLKKSWDLAPNNLELARQRIDLIGLLANDVEGGDPFTEFRGAILADAAILGRFIPAELEAGLELSDFLTDLLAEGA